MYSQIGGDTIDGTEPRNDGRNGDTLRIIRLPLHGNHVIYRDFINRIYF